MASTFLRRSRGLYPPGPTRVEPDAARGAFAEVAAEADLGSRELCPFNRFGDGSPSIHDLADVLPHPHRRPAGTLPLVL
jgi:hypothetical protein